jgi:hypothetical protein
MLRKLADVSGYSVDEILGESADGLPESDATTPEDAMLSRGDALAWIDDQDDMPESIKQRMRDALRKYQETRWFVQQLEVMAELLSQGAPSIEAHRAGKQRGVEEDIRIRGEQPIDLQGGGGERKRKPTR